MPKVNYNYNSNIDLSPEKLQEIKEVLDKAIVTVKDNGIIEDTHLTWDIHN